MSTNNRQRRQQKQRRRQQQRRQDQRHRQRPTSDPRGEHRSSHRSHEPGAHSQPEHLVMAALDALARGAMGEVDRTIAAVAADPGAAHALDALIGQWLESVVEHGWDERLAARVVRKAHGAPAAAWIEGEGVDVRDGIHALHALSLLPPLPRYRAAAKPAEDVDAKVLAKVRALLAKAESTEFAEEAEAYTAKAQELMSRHAIDGAMLDEGGTDAPTGRHVPVEDPYAEAKALLLDKIAKANRCRAIYSGSLGISTLLGFERDLLAVDLLFTSLLVQASRSMLAAGELSRHARQRGFRKSFLVSFAVRIGERLAEATQATADAADAEHDGRLLPVLARRESQVEEEVERLFPDIIRKPTSASDPYGWSAGRAAADLADLSAGPQVPN